MAGLVKIYTAKPNLTARELAISVLLLIAYSYYNI